MTYTFEIKESDMPDKHWLIIKSEEESKGFRMEKSVLNMLQIAIKDYLDANDEG